MFGLVIFLIILGMISIIIYHGYWRTYKFNSQFKPMINITINFLRNLNIPLNERKIILKKIYLKKIKLKRYVESYINENYSTYFLDLEADYELIDRFFDFKNKKIFLRNLMKVTLNYNLFGHDVIEVISKIGDNINVGGSYIAEIILEFYYEGFKEIFAEYYKERKERDPDFKRKDFKADPYNLLGISPQTSIEGIKKAYKKKVLKFHPDRFIHKNKFEKRDAEEQMKLINIAYQIIKIQRGF